MSYQERATFGMWRERLDAWWAHMLPRGLLALALVGPVVVGAILGWLLIGFAYDRDRADLRDLPSPPAEWLDDPAPAAADNRGAGFGKTL